MPEKNSPIKTAIAPDTGEKKGIPAPMPPRNTDLNVPRPQVGVPCPAPPKRPPTEADKK